MTAEAIGCGDEPHWGTAEGGWGEERSALFRTEAVGDQAVDEGMQHRRPLRAVAAALRGVLTAVTVVAVVMGVITLVEVGPARATDLPGQVFSGTTVPPRSAPPTRPSSVTTAPIATAPTSIPTKVTSPTVSRTPAVTATPTTAPRAAVPPQSYAPATYPRTTAAPATAAPTIAATTIAPIGNSLPVSPVTLPLRTKGSNAHVSPVFAILSGIGFFLALVIVIGRLVVTRPGGRDRRTLPVDAGDLG